MTDRATMDRDLQPLRKGVFVPVARADAFQRFTAEIGKWWPLRSHSVGGDNTAEVIIEARAGGLVYERGRDNTTHPWGEVLSWNPPDSFRMSWYPGRSPETAQEVEVRFNDVESGTWIELVQTGWEKLGDLATSKRHGYETGWDTVLARFEALMRSAA